jgi:hypothetical protein
MRTTFALFAAACLSCACASPPRASRMAPVPLGPAAPSIDVTRNDPPRAAANRSPAPPAPIAETQPPSDIADVQVTWRTVTQVVETERVVEVPAPAPATPAWSSGYYSDGYQDGYTAGRYPRRFREPWFPVNTLVGIGVGSLFDHHHHGHWHHGHRHRHHHHGAWIGGGVGLMLDLHRLWR